jgi:hypothetical protein
MGRKQGMNIQYPTRNVQPMKRSPANVFAACGHAAYTKSLFHPKGHAKKGGIQYLLPLDIPCSLLDIQKYNDARAGYRTVREAVPTSAPKKFRSCRNLSCLGGQKYYDRTFDPACSFQLSFNS